MINSRRPPSKQTTLSQDTLVNFLEQRAKSHLTPAVFLDRDGTINVERGYITDPSGIELLPGVVQVLQKFRQMGFLIVIISNQSAIARNLMTETQFEGVNEALWNLLQQFDACYDGFYYCPHSPDIFPPCECRKPQPGLILQAALDFQIDLSASYFIGDKLTDIEAGHRSGCKAILILTGKGNSESKQGDMNTYSIPDSIQETLGTALEWIFNGQS